MPMPISRASRSGTWRGWRRRCCRCWIRTRMRRSCMAQEPSPASPGFFKQPTAGLGASWAVERGAGDLELAKPARADGERRSRFHAGVPAPGVTPRSARARRAVRTIVPTRPAFDGWAVRWRERLAAEGGAPKCAAPACGRQSGVHRPQSPGRGGHRGRRAASADFGPFDRLVAVLAAPYRRSPEASRSRRAAAAGQGRAPDLLRHLTYGSVLERLACIDVDGAHLALGLAHDQPIDDSGQPPRTASS